MFLSKISVSLGAVLSAADETGGGREERRGEACVELPRPEPGVASGVERATKTTPRGRQHHGRAWIHNMCPVRGKQAHSHSKKKKR